MSKDMHFVMHERLVAKYMEDHPDVDWTTAYVNTQDGVDKAVRDWAADQIDYYRMLAKEGLK